MIWAAGQIARPVEHVLVYLDYEKIKKGRGGIQHLIGIDAPVLQ